MMSDKLDEAFDELEFDVSETYRKQNYIEQQKAVATGVTDGTEEGLINRIIVLEAFVTRMEKRISKLEDRT
jgi:hypothetical protein